MIPEKSRRTHRMGHISRGAARVTHAPRPCVMIDELGRGEAETQTRVSRRHVMTSSEGLH
jgi:hypothetical protein